MLNIETEKILYASYVLIDDIFLRIVYSIIVKAHDFALFRKSRISLALSNLFPGNFLNIIMANEEVVSIWQVQ